MKLILPSKVEFMKKLDRTRATKAEKDLVSAVYDFSLRGHLRAPPRATGEHYFWHPYEAAMDLLDLFIALDIWDLKSLLILLLHDTIEDAEEAGFSPELMHRNVVRRFGTEITFGTMAITKQRGEHSHHVLKRLPGVYYWRSHLAKVKDRKHNLKTLYGMKKKSQVHKLRETEQYFPAIFNRLEAELNIRVKYGYMPKAWLEVVPILREEIAVLIAENKSRLKKET